MTTYLLSILSNQKDQLHQMSQNIVANFLEQYDKTILKQLEFAIYLSESNSTSHQELYQHIVEDHLYSDNQTSFNYCVEGIDDITCATKDQIYESVSRKWLAHETTGKVWVGYRTAFGMLLNLNLHYGTLSFYDMQWMLYECLNDRMNSYDPNKSLMQLMMYNAYSQIIVKKNFEKDAEQLVKTYGKFFNRISTEEIVFDYLEKKKKIKK